MITKFKLFERKGNYQLFHKTGSLKEIIDSGYIEGYFGAFDIPLRKNVIPNWKPNKFKTISATRNFNYRLFGDTIELDVEKISDRYKIIPYSENPDFYLDFADLSGDDKQHGWGRDLKKWGKMEPKKNKNLTNFQQQLGSKSKGAGELYWRVKTDRSADDFGIAEELILTDKLDVGKYVKRIFMSYPDESLKRKIKEKYPHIEVIEMSENNPYYNKRKYQKVTSTQYQEA